MRSTLFLTGLGVLGACGLALGFSSQSGAWRDPSPHQVRRVTVDSSVQLEVLDWGGSGPPVVLLACYVSAHVYDEFAPKLTNQFRVVGITRRGIGASDKPDSGYAVQRSANDLLEVLNALKVQKSILVGHSCAGQVLTMFAGQHSDRLLGLVYLDGASDPTTTPADVGAAMPDPATLPRPIRQSAPDNSSFEALRASQRRDRGWAFPEGELRQQYVENADGSVGRPVLSPVIRRAITFDARVKPDYSGIRVPVLAIYQKDPPFEEVAANYLIRNEQERAALRQEHTATRGLYVRWQRDLLASVPTARIVELQGASLYMFGSNEADVLREIPAFAATLAAQPGAAPRDQSANLAKDREEITSILSRWEEAWSTHDMAAFASLFHEDGIWILWTGEVWTGRRVIEEGHAAVHKTVFRNSTQREDLEELRFVGPDAAIMRFCSVLTGDERAPNDVIRSRKFVVVTRRQGAWKVSWGQNTRLASSVPDSDCFAKLRKRGG
jgi:non-heme chloroperoxidase